MKQFAIAVAAVVVGLAVTELGRRAISAIAPKAA